MLARYTLFTPTIAGPKINIPFIHLKRFEPGFHSALMAKLQAMTLNAQFIGGAEVSTLEARLAEKVEVSHAVTCANGTDALQLALRAVGVDFAAFEEAVRTVQPKAALIAHL